MNTQITGVYRWSKIEYIDAYHLSALNSVGGKKFYKNMRILGAVILVLGFIIFFFTETSTWEIGFPILLGGAFLAVPMYPRKWAEHLYTKFKDRDAEMTWQVNEDRILIKTEAEKNQLPAKFLWKDIKAVIQVQKGFLVYPRDAHFEWLPLHAFGGGPGGDEFAELASSKVRDYSRR